MPANIPQIPRAFFNNIGGMSLTDIAFVVASAFFADDVPVNVLKSIVDDAFSTPIQLEQLTADTFVLELFRGPTLTFKDYGARFMARLLQYFDKDASVPRHVLIATTGNTGAAAASGFYRMQNVDISVLYPKGTLNSMQKSELVALGENIYPVEVAGSIDDCKRLIQTAMTDESLSCFNLTGANSINIARLIPQVTFALYAYSRLVADEHRDADKAVFSIPAGNYSNVVATAIARKMGMPMRHIIAAPGHAPRKHSLTPSIDMLTPTGLPRLTELYNNDLNLLRSDITIAPSVEDATIADVINRLRRDHSYTIDPHGAVAMAAAEKFDADGAPKIVFATGHPAKQLDAMTRITGGAIEMPHQINKWMTGRRQPLIIPPTLPALRKHLHSIK
ncbi:MAG: threonine synthase [Muribaculaceae bacterium]|nr:threonine synthase [Muribaculaceae bacterium]